MQLVTFSPIGCGPFYKETTLDVSPTVTVLTGGNDTGKTSLLRLIAKSLGLVALKQNEVNKNVKFESQSGWKNDRSIKCRLVFRKQALGRHGMDVSVGSLITVDVNLTSNTPTAKVVSNEGLPNFAKHSFKAYLPEFIDLSDTEVISDTLKLGELSPAELRFLSAGMEGTFSSSTFLGLEEIEKEEMLTELERGLNSKFHNLFSDKIFYEFKLKLSSNASAIHIFLRDQHDGQVVVSQRSTGVKKVLGLVGHLFNLPKDTSLILLIDEVETSLHAGAQRQLRAFLEELSKDDRVQVIYSTHSPTMINTFFPDTIRIVEREKDVKATSVVRNYVSGDGFSAVRSSLGVLPSDSLLYADVALVVEGDTEAYCLPGLLRKFYDASIDGFCDVPRILSNIHIINGVGDNIKKLCKVAKSHGSTPVVFVDGDKSSLSIPEVAIVRLPKQIEMEDAVSIVNYLTAANDILSLGSDGPTLEQEYQKWSTEQDFHEKMMLSKKLEKWFINQKDRSIKKALILKAAINITDASDISHAATFRELCKTLIEKISTVESR